MWAMLQILNHQDTSYCDQIPSPGLVVVFSKTSDCIGIYIVLDPNSYKEYNEDLQKFLKWYDLEEQKDPTVGPNKALFEQKDSIYVGRSVCFLIASMQWYECS